MTATFTDEMQQFLATVIAQSSSMNHSYLLRRIENQFNVRVGLRTLQRMLAILQLTRTAQYVPSDAELVTLVNDVQSSHANQIGGQMMLEYARLRQPDWRVTQERIRQTLRSINPNAVQVRRELHLHPRTYISKGPNHVWHIDQYDKLKPYFPIHACIDGYSRKILWMCVVPSNNNPHNIVELYLNAVANIGGCPEVTRTDRGNENELIAAAQRHFRSYQVGDDHAYRSHRWGSSPSNSRIESSWSRFRRGGGVEWMEAIQRLKDRGYLDDSDDHIRRMFQLVCIPVVTAWLDEWVGVWNRHRIRRSRSHNMVPGRPTELYAVPNPPAQQCIQRVTPNVRDNVRQAMLTDRSLFATFMTDAERTAALSDINEYLHTVPMSITDINQTNWEGVFKEIMRHRLQQRSHWRVHPDHV